MPKEMRSGIGGDRLGLAVACPQDASVVKAANTTSSIAIVVCVSFSLSFPLIKVVGVDARLIHCSNAF